MTRHFLGLLLITTIFVQGLQLRENQLSRERWQTMRIYWDAREANAIVPIAVAASYLPGLLAGIVTGSAVGWTCYTNGGKEAWARAVDASYNGARVTKDWLKKTIADLHGIDTTAAPPAYSPVNNQICYNGRLYPKTSQFTALQPDMGEVVFKDAAFKSWPFILDVYVRGAFYETDTSGKKWYNYTIYRCMYERQPSSAPLAPAGWTPEQNPELYDSQHLYGNCVKVVNAFPTIVPIFETSNTPPADWDALNGTVQDVAAWSMGSVTCDNGTVFSVADFFGKSSNTITDSDGNVYSLSAGSASKGVATDSLGREYWIDDILAGATPEKEMKITREDGSVVYLKDAKPTLYVDAEGKILNKPPAELTSNWNLDVPELDHTAYSGAAIAVASSQAAADKGQADARKLLPGWLDARLKGAGIDLDKGSTIQNVTKDGRVEWTDSKGVARATLVDTALAEQLVTQGAAVSSTASGVRVISVTTGTAAPATTATPPPFDPGPDPGNPGDPSFGLLNLDTNFDWGEEYVWPWEDWLAHIPFLNFLRQMRVAITDADSVISCDVNLFGRPSHVYVDFAQYTWVFSIMGSIIYVVTSWRAILLAMTNVDV